MIWYEWIPIVLLALGCSAQITLKLGVDHHITLHDRCYYNDLSDPSNWDLSKAYHREIHENAKVMILFWWGNMICLSISIVWLVALFIFGRWL